MITLSDYFGGLLLPPTAARLAHAPSPAAGPTPTPSQKTIPISPLAWAVYGEVTRLLISPWEFALLRESVSNGSLGGPSGFSAKRSEGLRRQGSADEVGARRARGGGQS